LFEAANELGGMAIAADFRDCQKYPTRHLGEFIVGWAYSPTTAGAVAVGQYAHPTKLAQKKGCTVEG
jgi:hypothetical protein